MRIHQIEAGFPVVSNEEKRSVTTIANEGLDANILALCRTKKEDIDTALDCNVDGISPSSALPPSTLSINLK
ncbi:2-isopropylmalate synthase [anaerobic digester metagenome]